MFGTRLHYPQAPAIDPTESTLIVTWYGSRNQVDHERVDSYLDDLVSSFGFASGHAIPVALEHDRETRITASHDRNIVVLPIFMCDGVAMRNFLPNVIQKFVDQHVSKPRVHMLPTVGRHESLTRLVSDRASERLGHHTKDATLLLIAHGSNRNKQSVTATRAIRDRIRRTERFRQVCDAYLEASPSASDVMSAVEGNCVVEGLFLTEGRHGTHDLEACIQVEYLGRTVSSCGVIGADPRLVEVLRSVVHDAVYPKLAA